MTRGDFFKAIGLLAIAGLPFKTKGQKLPNAKILKGKIAIDIRALNIDRYSAAEILEIYNETGMLIYDGTKGNPPIPLEEFEDLTKDVTFYQGHLPSKN